MRPTRALLATVALVSTLVTAGCHPTPSTPDPTPTGAPSQVTAPAGTPATPTGVSVRGVLTTPTGAVVLSGPTDLTPVGGVTGWVAVVSGGTTGPRAGLRQVRAELTATGWSPVTTTPTQVTFHRAPTAPGATTGAASPTPAGSLPAGEWVQVDAVAAGPDLPAHLAVRYAHVP